MRALFIILLFFLFFTVPTFSLEDIADYNEVVIDIIIDAKFNLVEKSTGGRIKDFEADLLFYPISTENQEIIALENFISEGGKVTQNDTAVKYYWGQPVRKSIDFKRIASVKSISKLVRIKDKIKFPVSPYDFSPEIRQYLLPSPKIDITPEIKAQAESLARGETDLYFVAHNIASWVNEYVNYTLTEETEYKVLPSSWVFDHKIGVCDEIANLFVSMMRAVGIPARFTAGVVYSNADAGFGNHGWSEVYFPGYGWIPFDATFGQYGYVDPGHIKFQDSTDSGVSALEYRWKSRDIDVISEYLNVSAVLKEKRSTVGKIVDISVSPYEKEINFGSYLPIRITLKNLEDYYVPTTVYITKSPKIIGSTVKQVLLRPEEEKDIYFLAQIDNNLDNNYLYQAIIEAKTNWLTIDETTIEYHKQAKLISKIEAEEIVKSDEEREQKEFFSDLEIFCDADKKGHYIDERVNISCAVINSGNINLDVVNVCLDNSCEDISLGIGGYKEFFYYERPKEEFIFAVETQNKFKEEKIDVNIVNIPVVSISNLDPVIIDYRENRIFSFDLEQKDAENLNVIVNGREVSVEDGKISLSLSGNDVAMGIVMDLVYEDAAGKEYSLRKRFSIDVKGLPFYLKIKRFLFGLFYT